MADSEFELVPLYDWKFEALSSFGKQVRPFMDVIARTTVMKSKCTRVRPLR